MYQKGDCPTSSFRRLGGSASEILIQYFAYKSELNQMIMMMGVIVE